MRVFGVVCAIVAMSLAALDGRAEDDGEAVPRFRLAKSVWHAGHEKEMNEQLCFVGKFVYTGVERPKLRITSSNPYRVRLNGGFAWYGPARGPKGFFRADEVPLNAKKGTNVVEIEVAGYNCANFYFQKQPSLLQAEVECVGKIVLWTDVHHGAGTFTVRRAPRIQKVNRYSHARAFGEAYALPACEETHLELSEIEGGPVLPRIAAAPDFSVADDFAPLSGGGFRYNDKKTVKMIGFVDRAGTPNVDGFSKQDLAYDLWDSSQRFELSRGIVPSVAESYCVPAGRYVLFAAPKLRSGFLLLNVKCVEPGELQLLFDELLVDGELRPWRSSVANSAVWRFDKPGDYVIETFEPYVLKYVAAAVRAGRFEISSPRLRLYRNAESRNATFDSSDPELNALFSAAEENFAQNAVDGFMDCPGRERANWNCDAYFTARASYLLTGNVRQETLFLDNYARPAHFDQVVRGMIPMCYPSDFPDGDFIPSWAMFFVLQLDEYVRERGGDPGLVERLRPRVLELVDFLSRYKNAEGLLENLPRWVFVEWSKAKDYVQGVNYPNNMVWAATLAAAGRLYGRQDLVAEAERTHETIRRLSYDGHWFRDQSLRQSNGVLSPTEASSETCQYYAFAFGTASKDRYPELYGILTTDFGPDRIRCGRYSQIWPSAPFIGNFLRLDWLGREGLVTRQMAEMKGYFGYMVKTTGTMWENANSADNGSCCHGFTSHVAVFLLRDVLGVRKIDGNRQEVVFSPPVDSPLEYCRAKMPVNGGFVEVGWSRKDGQCEPLQPALPRGWSLRVVSSGKEIIGGKSR